MTDQPDQPDQPNPDQGSSSPREGGNLTCPHCMATVNAQPKEQAQVVLCDRCKQVFILPGVDGYVPPVAQAPGAQPFVVDDGNSTEERDDLDGVKIRQLAAVRRAAFRSRSYCVVGAMFCMVASGQLIFKATVHLRSGENFRLALLYLAIVPLCWSVAYRFYRRAQQLQQEATQSSLTEPLTPPDFSPLSDGSQRWNSLGPRKTDGDSTEPGGE
jgi:hypothetical protein